VVGVIAKPLVRTIIMMINLLRMQTHLEDAWASDIKEPNYIIIILDISSAMKAFEKVKTILTRIRGATGVPLVFVMRHQLIPVDKDDDPPFGEEATKYTSIDMETTACTPIVTDDSNYTKE
jgi:hypothetical protein